MMSLHLLTMTFSPFTLSVYMLYVTLHLSRFQRGMMTLHRPCPLPVMIMMMIRITRHIDTHNGPDIIQNWEPTLWPKLMESQCEDDIGMKITLMISIIIVNVSFIVGIFLALAIYQIYIYMYISRMMFMMIMIWSWSWWWWSWSWWSWWSWWWWWWWCSI